MHCTPGSVDGCVKLLLETNEVLLLSPGGVREALFSDNHYNVLWGNRRGFAKIALKAKKVRNNWFLLMIDPVWVDQ